LESLGNIIEEDCARLLSRPYTETQMESTQPDFNGEYMNPICAIDMVNLQQTHARSIWTNPSRSELYKKFNFSRPPFDPLTFVGVKIGPSGQTIDRPIEQVVNNDATSIQFQSNTRVIFLIHIQGNLIVTPTTPLLQPTTPCIP
jgi:hypothetical protein